MLDERSELTRTFAKAASGHTREAVINAGGNMVINALRQSHARLEEAERELDDLVERMRAALRENHYTAGGDRRVTNIIVPPLRELLHHP
jgi:chaperonin GroEL (HSP60 family)